MTVARLHDQYDSLARQHATARLGMWIFLASEAMLFAGLFALYAGLVFVACATLVIAPLLHRLLHRFHVSEKT